MDDENVFPFPALNVRKWAGLAEAIREHLLTNGIEPAESVEVLTAMKGWWDLMQINAGDPSEVKAMTSETMARLVFVEADRARLRRLVKESSK